MKYLLTGGSGVLGTELQKHLDCFAPSSIALDISCFSLDDYDSYRNNPIWKFESLYGEHLTEIDTLIHCAGYTDVPGSEVFKDEAVEANIIGTRNMDLYACRKNWKFVYISSDYVYEGVTGNYKETDETKPFNFYGFTKAAGEALVTDPDDLIIRTSFKPNDLWESKYDAAFGDLWTSADFVDVIAKEIAFVIKAGAKGILNVGTECKTIYDLAKSRFPNVKMIDSSTVSNVKMPKQIDMNLDRLNKLKNTWRINYDC